MRIGISRPSRTPDEAYEVFNAARRSGFDGVQIKPHQYQPYLAASSKFTEVYGDLAQLASAGMVVYLGANTDRWPELVSNIFPFASEIGAEILCLVAGVEREDASDQRYREVAELLTQLGQRAQRSNTRISLHNHANCLFESASDLASLFKYIDPALCGFTLDTAHAAKGGIEDVPALVTQFSEHLDNVHLKDMNSAGQFCPLGLGELDLPPILDALNAVNYDGWLIVDEESKEYSTDDAYRLSMEFLKQHNLR